MSETDTNTQGQKPKAFRPSTVSLVLAFVALLMAGLFANFSACAPAAIIGLIFGIVGLCQTKKNRSKPVKADSAICGIVINLLLILMALAFGSINSHDRTRELARRAVCGGNLKDLGTAMHRYANDNNQNYPPVNKWCDFLIQSGYISEKEFKCIGDKNGPCSYAINPNTEPNSPNDVVLLFETTGGWNQVGGPEILSTENHLREGCWILFNDGHAKFVKTEYLEELKWKVEEGNSVE